MAVHLHHVNLRTTDLERTIAFYTEAIGLKTGWRPDFGFQGAWLYDGARPAVHLNLVGKAGRNDDVSVDHVAFAFDALDPVLANLDRLNLRYTRPRLVPGTEIRQCFTEDPNGVTVELQGP
jgi:catechol 2,3-dioxygenase-like lactoylglutathione lyase family enzyme